MDDMGVCVVCKNGEEVEVNEDGLCAGCAEVEGDDKGGKLDMGEDENE